MESYAFRPKQTGLPKLTNSTFYKTSKLAKTKNNSTVDMNIHNLSNINNTSQTNKSSKSKVNSKDPMFIKRVINFSKISSKNRSISLQNRNVSSQETDDSLFALSQIRNMDRLIEKRINKKVVWKQKARNIYEVNASRNVQTIKSIKDQLHQSRFEDSKNFDLKNEINRKKYFPIERVQVINDAKKIVKNIEYENYKNKSTKNFFVKKRVDIHSFVVQNREICLKNNMIKILKKESDRIKQKEIDYSAALKHANIGIKKDEEAFAKFIVQHQILTKQKELEVDEAKRAKKRSLEALYLINATMRIKYDEVERIIKNIITYYSYAEFIHRIIGSQTMKNIDIKKLIIKQGRNRAKDTKYLIDTAFSLFGFLLDKNNSNNTDLDFDAEQMTYLFNSLEQAIMKSVVERDCIIKEMETQNNYSDLIFLQNKKSQHKEELAFLTNELNYLNKLYQPLNKEYEENLKNAENYIKEILFVLQNENEIIRDYENTDPIEKDDICKQTFDILSQLEKKVVFYINEIDNIEQSQKENDNDFKIIIEQVRNENKRIKIKNNKKLLEDLEEEKLKKIQQRINKIPIVNKVEYIPPWILKERKKHKKVKTTDKDKDKQLLYYH